MAQNIVKVSKYSMYISKTKCVFLSLPNSSPHVGGRVWVCMEGSVLKCQLGELICYYLSISMLTFYLILVSVDGISKSST